MKVRWTGESIRLRITPAELETLNRNEIVRESVPLTGGEWTAHIVPGSAHTEYAFVEGALQVNLSVKDRAELDNPETEGVYFEPTAGCSVRLYIEKDFPCIHPRVSEAKEPQTETFAALQKKEVLGQD